MSCPSLICAIFSVSREAAIAADFCDRVVYAKAHTQGRVGCQRTVQKSPHSDVTRTHRDTMPIEKRRKVVRVEPLEREAENGNAARTFVEPRSVSPGNAFETFEHRGNECALVFLNCGEADALHERERGTEADDLRDGAASRPRIFPVAGRTSFSRASPYHVPSVKGRGGLQAGIFCRREYRRPSGPYILCPENTQKVAIKLLYVNGNMRNTLRRVYEYDRARLVCGGYHLGDRINRA